MFLQKSSGLFSLLPAPIHSAKKEINRPLIPHTLTKKPTLPKKDTQVKEVSSSQNNNDMSSTTKTQSRLLKKALPIPSAKHKSTFNSITGYDSDSDENDKDDDVPGRLSNFFSLGQSSGSISSASDSLKVKSSDDFSVIDSSYKGSTIKESALMNDAPLQFGKTKCFQSWASSSHSNLLPVGPIGPVGSSAVPTVYPEFDNIQSNMAYAEVIIIVKCCCACSAWITCLTCSVQMLLIFTIFYYSSTRKIAIKHFLIVTLTIDRKTKLNLFGI